MPTFRIGFWDHSGPEERLVADFHVSRPSEREAIELATNLFAERYPERRIEDHSVRCTPGKVLSKG
jgi:hypothetical protein